MDNQQEAMKEREQMVWEAFERLQQFIDARKCDLTDLAVALIDSDIEILRAELGFNKGKS